MPSHLSSEIIAQGYGTEEFRKVRSEFQFKARINHATSD